MRCTNTGIRERSSTKLYFTPEADLPLKFIDTIETCRLNYSNFS